MDRPETHDAILVPVDVFVGDCQTQGAATTCSSSRAVRFGMEGATGVQNGELQVVEVGELETKDAAGEGPPLTVRLECLDEHPLAWPS